MGAPKLTDRAGAVGRDYIPEQAPVLPDITPEDGWGDPAAAKLAWARMMAEWQEGQRVPAEMETREHRSRGGRRTADRLADKDRELRPYLNQAHAALQAEGFRRPGRDRLLTSAVRMFTDDPRVDVEEFTQHRIRRYLASI